MGNLFHWLQDAAENNNLILKDGGLCLYKLRKRDRAAVVSLLVVLPHRRRQGVGRSLLGEVVACRPACVEARLPKAAPAGFWLRMGFSPSRTVPSRRPGGPGIVIWRLELPENY